jgi:hypothetical protein
VKAPRRFGGIRMSSPTPGWYQDPTDPGIKRWWDGTAWSTYTQSPLPGAKPQSSLSQLEWAAVGGPRPKRLFSKTFLWIVGSLGAIIVLLITFVVVMVLISQSAGH